MDKSMTKKDYFNEIIDLATAADREDLVTFAQHEVELLERRSSTKRVTKNQEANESIKGVILEALVGKENPSTIAEIQEANEEIKDYSNQKISALLAQLVKEGKIVRTMDKRKAYFSIAD